MDYVVGVSWPRSGHHLVARLLQLYFAEEFIYCNYYGGIEGCCKTLPCARAGEVTFTKSHDFDLELPQVEGQKYLVQYRDFVPSVVSNFELFVREGGPDTPEGFRSFASSEFGRYRRFVRKWVLSDFGQRQLVLNYADLLNDPAVELARMVGYFDPDHAVDEARIRTVIAEVDGEKVENRKVERLHKVGVHPSRDVTEFRHYSPTLFEQLGRMTLTREEVRGVFVSLLGRAPAEENMIGFQALPSIEALEECVLASARYAEETQPDLSPERGKKTS